MSFKVQSITYQPPQGMATAASLGATPQQSEMAFLEMISAEISNQSPDQPMDSTSMITQYTQMNSAVAFQQMASTAGVYQDTSTAGSLLNKDIMVLNPDGKTLSRGMVSAIDYSGNKPQLTVNGQQFPLDSVLKVLG